jgi:hypothetical protein
VLVKTICESYFNCFSEIKNYKENDARVNAFAVLKILSIATVIVPLGFGIAYGLGLLVGRIQKNFSSLTQKQAVNTIAQESLKISPIPTLKQVKISVQNCPEWFKPFYQKTPTKFTEKIWQSNDYTEVEKTLLFGAAKSVYQNQKTAELLSNTGWVSDTITVEYLKWLSLNNPTFSSIPCQNSQLVEKTLENEMEEKIISILPTSIDQGPRIYGHPLQVGGNHRTAFVIDMDNHTVEYFNSFGNDIRAEKPLQALKKALSKKYKVAFSYQHRTANIRLQPDTYQCGIWACKLVEERFKLGINFNPASCKKSDIAEYRRKVFAKVYEIQFFKDVGANRYSNYLDSFLEDDQAIKIDAMIDCSLAPKQSIDIIFPLIQFGKENKIPSLLKNLTDQAVGIFQSQL